MRNVKGGEVRVRPLHEVEGFADALEDVLVLVLVDGIVEMVVVLGMVTGGSGGASQVQRLKLASWKAAKPMGPATVRYIAVPRRMQMSLMSAWVEEGKRAMGPASGTLHLLRRQERKLLLQGAKTLLQSSISC